MIWSIFLLIIYRILGNYYRSKLRQNAVDIIIPCVPTIDVMKYHFKYSNYIRNEAQSTMWYVSPQPVAEMETGILFSPENESGHGILQ